MQAVYEILPGGTSYWIGLSDTSEEGNFVWNDGTALGFASYADWRRNEPNDYGNGEDCVQMYKDDGWNDIPCNRRAHYVCQHPADYVKDDETD